jgi:hypothetical protein
MRYLINTLAVVMLACCCQAQGKGKPDTAPATNAVPVKAVKEKERKAEHLESKITIKARDKGSKKESDFKTERVIPLMFANNRKAKKTTPKKESK